MDYNHSKWLRYMIPEIFDQINYDIFCGELDPINIIVSDTLLEYQAWGVSLFEDDILINIHIHNDLDYAIGWCTLAHEMIHYKMWVDHDKFWTHNMTFKMYARQIEKFYNLKGGAI